MKEALCSKKKKKNFERVKISRPNNNTNTFNCGEITNVGYPFWGAGQAGACGNPQISPV